jgi:hypothetical protein
MSSLECRLEVEFENLVFIPILLVDTSTASCCRLAFQRPYEPSCHWQVSSHRATGATIADRRLVTEARPDLSAEATAATTAIAAAM